MSKQPKKLTPNEPDFYKAYADLERLCKPIMIAPIEAKGVGIVKIPTFTPSDFVLSSGRFKIWKEPVMPFFKTVGKHDDKDEYKINYLFLNPFNNTIIMVFHSIILTSKRAFDAYEKAIESAVIENQQAGLV